MLGVIGKYVVSGGLAAIAHFAILIGLVELFGVSPTVASAIGFFVAIFVNYSFQYHWTFKSSISHSTAFGRYLSVTLAMLGVNTAIFWTLNERIGVPYIASQVVATGIVLIFNFLINHFYTFAAHSPSGPQNVSR